MSIEHEQLDRELTACLASVLDLHCSATLPLCGFERRAGVETGYKALSL